MNIVAKVRSGICRSACLVASIGWSAAQVAQAAPIAAASMPAQQCNFGASTQNQIQGFSFTPTVNLIVTALGVADCNMNGLNLNTPVGLYRGDGTLLVDTSLAAGAGAALEGTIRFSDIAGVTLQAGTEYRIFSFMEHDSGEPALLNPTVTFAPEIAVNGFYALQDGGFHSSLPGLMFINSPFCCEFFGPSFKFEAAPTSAPEPATLPLLAVGLLGFAVPQLRRLSRKR